METPSPTAKKPSSRSKRVNVEVPEMLTEIPSPGAQPIMHLRGRMLGKGGFAAVYELQNMQDGTVLAGKAISKESLQKARAKQKLETEISIHRSLKHPAIVRFIRSFEDNTNVYLLLECCTGKTLADLVRNRTRLTDAEAADVLSQTIDAVKSLHADRIIHRDLKLSNLFLDRDGRVKVGDFGLACQLSHDGERKTTICGTPNYIAPEVLSGKQGHSYEVDVWSLGVVLYTLLIGKPPFETADVRSTYRRIRSNAYFFPEGVPISEEAADLIRRVLRTEPELRPSLDGMLKHPFFTRFDAPEKAAISVAYQPKRVPAEADGRGQDGVVQIDVWAGGEAASRVKYSPDLRLPASLHIPPPLSPNPSSGWPTREQQVAVLPTQQSAGSAASLRLQRSNSGLGDSNIDTLSHCPLSPSTFSSVSSAFASNAVSRTASSSLAGGLLSRTASIAVADRSSSGSRNRLLNISPGGTPTSRQQLASKDCGFVVSRSTSGGSAPDGAAASGSSAPVSPGTWTPQDAAAKLAEWDQQRALEAREQAERMRDWNQKAGQAKTTQDLESVAKQLQRQQSALQSYRDRFEYGSAVKGLDSPRVASACKGEPGAESHTITVSVRCDAALLVPLADQVTGSAEAANSPGPRAVLGTFPAGRPPRGGSLPRDNKGLFGEEASFEVLKPDAGLGPFSSGTANSSADDSRKLASAASSAKTGSTLLVQKPSVWVAKWVDYSSKYGMGYVLSNGAVGVLFNDGTKIVLLADRSKYIYLEKPRASQGAARSGAREERTVLLTHEEPPDNLKKKATLLWYFEGYLKGSSFRARSDKHPGRVSGECVGPGIPGDGAVDASRDDVTGGTYVKKWLKTKHAIIFRLSNKVIQVDFNDGTEIVLSSEMQSVTYVNKSRASGTHWLTHLPQDMELLKRLKYTKDILLQLIGGASSPTATLPGFSTSSAQTENS